MSKDLAKEYTKRTYKEKTNYPIMWRDKVFTGKDIEAAAFDFTKIPEDECPF